MDCEGVRQNAGDAIDRSLCDDVAAEFETHLKRCHPCRREIAIEKFSKFMVRHHVPWMPTPRSTYNSILFSLQQEYQSRRSVAPLLFVGLLPSRFVIPALVGSFAAIFFFTLVTAKLDPSYPMTAHTASNDIINQSFKNFALVKSGRLEPNLVSSTPESVQEFLKRSNLQFGVHVPLIRDCEWCAASASEGNGVKQAHVIYKIGKELLYVFEVSDDDALYGTQISLSPAAKRALAQSGWYTDPDHPDCNVVLWRTDEAVCVAVSTMRRGQLLSLLTTR